MNSSIYFYDYTSAQITSSKQSSKQSSHIIFMRIICIWFTKCDVSSKSDGYISAQVTSSKPRIFRSNKRI